VADAVAESPAPAAGERAARTNRKRFGLALKILVPVAIAVGGAWYWLGHRGEVSTDNAYVKNDIVSVAAEVTGLVAAVQVRENQHVNAGDILFTIDPAPYQVAIAQADAQIAKAQANMTALQADVGANAADIAGANDDLALAEATYSREKALMDRGFNTRARMDAAQHAVAVARDKLGSIRAEVEKARAQLANGSQVPGVNPAVAAGQAQRDQAELNLHRTIIRAPASGVVTQNSRLLVGQMAFPGVPMLSIVRDGSTRIDANFKETDLAHMQPGQRVDIEIDAYPGQKFRGRVDSIGAGTGSQFSLLPAQNATGNWVKVTQRVPVRIAIEGQQTRQLVAGLSSVVTVHVDGK